MDQISRLREYAKVIAQVQLLPGQPGQKIRYPWHLFTSIWAVNITKKNQCFLQFSLLLNDQEPCRLKFNMKTFEIWSKLLTIKNKLSCAKKPVLSPEDLEYISSSKGSISHDQIKEQFDSFVEQHPKGKISKKEFGEMMKTCLPDFDLVNNWTGSAEVSHIFRMYDKNGDGEIDFR